MSHRILSTLGVLAVVVMAMGTSVASAHPGVTAKLAGNGSSGNNDNNPPSSGWGNGWWGNDNNGRYWNGWGNGNGYFDGHSCDGCSNGSSSGSSAQAAAESGVARVMVAVKRLRGSRCQSAYSTGRLGHARRCSRTIWLGAWGPGAWRFDIPRKLPRGRYELSRRAIDAAGNRERVHRMRLSIR
jgi:hypothetical protein